MREGVPDSVSFHGAKVRITGNSFGIRHQENYGQPSRIVVRSYPDGIRVGCTFITSDALKTISKWHSDFLDGHEFKTHQEGECA